ncbi:hypothetical protein ACHOLT_10580 [Desulfitobacterium sp. Sab5]|uniref:hypothetical protein n=1 Tax=Desulfitobacterium nosdiversum TaxID=3375356 RepID=UPI003CE87FAB
MKKISDRIFLGFVSGMLGAIPGRLLNKTEFKLGLTDSRYEEMAAMLFVNKRDITKPKGKNVGRIANSLLTSVVGVTTTYVLSKTGRDYAALKGIGITSLAWLGIYGLSTQAKVRKSKKPGAALLSYLDHLILGATTATIISKLGDDTVFPRKQQEFNHVENMAQSTIPFNYQIERENEEHFVLH